MNVNWKCVFRVRDCTIFSTSLQNENENEYARWKEEEEGEREKKRKEQSGTYILIVDDGADKQLSGQRLNDLIIERHFLPFFF